MKCMLMVVALLSMTSCGGVSYTSSSTLYELEQLVLEANTFDGKTVNYYEVECEKILSEKAERIRNLTKKKFTSSNYLESFSSKAFFSKKIIFLESSYGTQQEFSSDSFKEFWLVNSSKHSGILALHWLFFPTKNDLKNDIPQLNIDWCILSKENNKMTILESIKI